MKDNIHRRPNAKKANHAGTVRKKQSSDDLNFEKLMIKDGVINSSEAYDILIKKYNDPNKVRAALKRGVLDEIRKHTPNADKHTIYLKSGAQDTISNFDAAKFIERKWRNSVFVIKNDAYQKLLTTRKSPIHIRSYNYDQPIYAFKNNYEFGTPEKANQLFSDASFYLSESEDILFAKVTHVEYSPITKKDDNGKIKKIDHKKINEKRKTLCREDKERIIYDSSLFNRQLSISMYVLLEGKPENAHLFMRYDDFEFIHTNTFVGKDSRKEVYGIQAIGPHFHFQTEDDSLLYLRKIPTHKNHPPKYRAGECSAIDAQHLKAYLIKLDECDAEEIADEVSTSSNYGMPFLYIKANSTQPLNCNIDKVIKNYLADAEDLAQAYLLDLVKDFEHKFPAKNYNTSDGKIFGKLIRALDFLQYLYDVRNNTTSLAQLEVLSQIEILASTEILDAMCQNSNKIMEKDFKPQYSIDASYLHSEESSEKDEDSSAAKAKKVDSDGDPRQ